MAKVGKANSCDTWISDNATSCNKLYPVTECICGFNKREPMHILLQNLSEVQF